MLRTAVAKTHLAMSLCWWTSLACHVGKAGPGAASSTGRPGVAEDSGTESAGSVKDSTVTSKERRASGSAAGDMPVLRESDAVCVLSSLLALSTQMTHASCRFEHLAKRGNARQHAFCHESAPTAMSCL